MELGSSRVVVVGLGASGVAAATMLARLGARVTGTDKAPLEGLSTGARGLASLGVELAAGGHDRAPWDACDLIVVSPGVPPLAEVARAEARGVLVTSELDLAWDVMGRPSTCAIGGTNGKSTTTTLVGELVAASGRRTFAGGNLGTPLASVFDERFDALVLEVSSFQAERMPSFHPVAATILNVTDDHLDRYPSFDAYAAAKGNMTAHMTAADLLVVPAVDPVTAHQASRSGARIVTFGREGDVRIGEDAIEDRVFGRSYSRAEIRLAGRHNAENVAASVVLAAAMGVSEETIRQGLATFAGLPHRIQLVAERCGVRYYDDSKGTNVGASVAALLGLSEPRAVLIAGGRDKHGSYAPLVDALRQKGRALVVIGEAKERLREAAEGVLPVAVAGSMVEAVALAASLARPGDAVLLSPACSSFDMFRDYEERGDVFAEAARALAEEGAR